jgi:hypothetical protein
LQAVFSVLSVPWLYNEYTLSGVKLGHPVPGGYKYGGDLTLQVGGDTDETVKYGREFCGTSTLE